MSLLDVAEAGEAIGKLVSFWTSRWRRATIP